MMLTKQELEKQATQLIQETQDHHDLCACVKCVALDALCADVLVQAETTNNKNKDISRGFIDARISKSTSIR